MLAFAARRLVQSVFVMLAAASIAIKFTGDFAAEVLEKTPGFDQAFIERHEQAADQASTGVFFMGIAAAVALFLSRGGRPTPKWSLGLLAVLVVATFLLMVRCANLGGHIRHPEIRPNASSTP